jgi:hypothetical protein
MELKAFTSVVLLILLVLPMSLSLLVARWWTSTSFQTLFTNLIIDPSLFWIRQHFIGLRDLLKFLGGSFFVSVLVWMMLQSHLPICLL